MFRNHRWWRAAIGASLGSMLLIGCGGSDGAATEASKTQADASPIKVAVISELSGTSAVVAAGRATQSGVDTVIRQVNAAGGIDGHPLDVTVYDGQTNPNAASAAIRRAIGDKPDYLLGFLASVDLTPSVAVVNSARIPWVYTAGLFKEIQTPYFFSISLSAKTTGGLLVQAAKRLLGGSLQGKNVAVEMLSPSPFNDDKAAAFKAAAEREGAQVVQTIRDPTNLTSWTSQAANVMAENVDAVITMHVDSGTAAIGKALGVAGYRGVILADPSASSDATLSSINLPNFYTLREAMTPDAGSDIYKKVLAAKASITHAQAAPAQFGRGYTGAWALVRALQKCGVPCSQAKFMSTLKSLGDVDVPLNPFYGPPNFTNEQSGIHTAQMFTFDQTAKKAVKSGPLLTVD